MTTMTIELQPLAGGARILAALTYDREEGWATVVDGTRYWSRHWEALCDGLARAGYRVLSPEPKPLPTDVRAALERLVTIALVPTGQGRRCANFLLA